MNSQSSPSRTPYRLCVVGVFYDARGWVLTGKRSDLGTYQLPQGGVDPGESPLEALYREMREELGVDKIIVTRGPIGLVRYDFPAGLPAKISKSYQGQEQWWYACQLNDQEPDLRRATSREFTEFRWMPIEECLAAIVDWKRGAYREGLKGLQLYRDP